MNEDLSARHKSCALHNQPSHSALSNWKICSGSRCWCVPYRRARRNKGKTAGTAAPVELLEEEWLGDEQTGSTPLLLSLAVNADSLATWLLPALAPVLADSPIRLNLQVEDETRTQERLRRGEVVGAVSIQHQALPSCLVDKLGALDYLFVSSKPFAEKYFPNGVTRSALLKAPVVAFDHLDDMHRAFCSKTSICLRAACPAISLILQKRSYNLLAGHHLLYDPAPANRERAGQR